MFYYGFKLISDNNSILCVYPGNGQKIRFQDVKKARLFINKLLGL